MAMTSCHRNVVQILLDQGVLSEQVFLETFGEVVQRYQHEAKRARIALKGDEEKDKKTLVQAVDLCNERLEPLGLKIAKMKHKDREGADGQEGTWNTYYGVVNLVEEDTKQDWMGKSEQEFFHKLVMEILGSDTKQIESQEATSIGRDLESTTKLNPTEANRCLERLTQGQWLAKSDDGYYSLGVRTELQRRYLASDSYTHAAAPTAEEQVAEVD